MLDDRRLRGHESRYGDGEFPTFPGCSLYVDILPIGDALYMWKGNRANDGGEQI
jgi:hypothetical protein